MTLRRKKNRIPLLDRRPYSGKPEYGRFHSAAP